MIIQNVRLAYVHLETPRAAVKGGEPRYSVTPIIPKNHPQMQEIRDAMRAALTEKWGDKAPKILRSALRDGDATDDNGERVKGEEFAGAYYLTASAKKPVEVLAGRARTVATSEHMRSGNYGHCKVRFFAYDEAGNKGVGAWLNGVWITKRGEPLGAAAEPWGEAGEDVEDFSEVAQRATAAGKQEDDLF